jgi:ATP-dependent DNA helicase RecG
MPHPTKAVPSWVSVFQNILKMEKARGFDNGTVVGGLDKFIQIWSISISEALDNQKASSDLLQVSYTQMSPKQRNQWVARWLKLLAVNPSLMAPAIESATSSQSPGANKRSSSKMPRPAVKLRLPPAGLTVDAPIENLRGLSVTIAARLKRLNVTSVRDLLYLFPRRHHDYSNIKNIAHLEPGQECTVIGQIWEARQVAIGQQGRLKATEAVMSDSTGNIKVIWFGQGYLARLLKPNSQLAISGKPEVFKGHLIFQSPEYELLNRGQAQIHTGRLVPIQPLTAGLSGRNLRRFTWQAIEEWLGGIEDPLPKALLARNHLMPLKDAIRQAHYPNDLQAWETARLRLAFDELLTLQLAVLARRRLWDQAARGIPIQVDAGFVERFIETLPFHLTGSQRRCIDEIMEDLRDGTPPMNRLLQGEVGSGKTVVVLIALLATTAAGYQGSIMVPTEVLAEQHFNSISQLLDGRVHSVQGKHLITLYLKSLNRPVTLGLLTGSTRRASKNELTTMAAEGTLDLLIGTHALIQSNVSLPGLALAVTDEQHRFGVMQRSALRQKGSANPHTLVMSATPIPRTLSLTLYGDLDISTIDELPPGRLRVLTRWVHPERREAAYGFVRKEVQAGRQAFVICPLVDESESIEAKAATEEFKRLSREVFPELRTGLLHGRMSAKDKNSVMRQFRDNDLDILVSTAVVEVGIDIANATVMVIEGADRFGLAQLHQFRGRVGRGEHKSYCLLLSESRSSSAQERLSAMERIHDGFQLAEVDLKLRGPGDSFGTRQSGLPSLRMARLSDRKLLLMARHEASGLIDQDPTLEFSAHILLAAQVARFMERVSAEAS